MTEQEMEEKLRNAFVVHKADYIMVNSRRQDRGMQTIAFGQEKGWLTPVQELSDDGGQYTEWRVRLTTAGRKHFGLES